MRDLHGNVTKVETEARRAVVVAAVVSVAGVAVAGTFSRTAGGAALVLGWLAFVYALHSYGRAGSERP